MKKTAALVLIALVMLATVLAGCNGQVSESPSSSPAVTQSPSVAPDDTTEADGEPIAALPLTAEKKTLRFLAKQEATLEDLATNLFTQWVEEQTNVHIEWEPIPQSIFGERFPLVLAGGDYPDVFFGCNITPDQEMQYGVQDKVFAPLNELIDKHGMEMGKMFAQIDWMKAFITAPDGNIYSLPAYSNILHVDYAQKCFVRKSWMEGLGIGVPQTTEDFYQMLLKFKNGDPNKNGNADEIPLAGSPREWHSAIYPFLVSAFILDEGMYSEHLTIKDGKVISILNTEEYREALRYLNKLYKEGLIDESSFTSQADQYKQLGETGLLGAGMGGGQIMFLTSNASQYYADYVTIPPLKGPAGVQVTPSYKYGDVRLGQYALSTNCSDPDLAIRLADFYYGYDATMRFRIGVKGVHWRDGEPSEKGLDGRDAVYTTLESYTGGVQNYHYGNTGLFFETNDMWTLDRKHDQSMDIMAPEAMQQFLHLETVKNYEPYGSKDPVPPARYLPDEQSEVSLLKTEITTSADEARVRFITGDLSLDNDWESYLQTLEKAGLPRFLELRNQAYARQYGNK